MTKTPETLARERLAMAMNNLATAMCDPRSGTAEMALRSARSWLDAAEKALQEDS